MKLQSTGPNVWAFCRCGIFLLCTLLVSRAEAFVHDALSCALEGAEKHVMEGEKKGDGYTLRKDFWQGDAPSGKGQGIKHQLQKGNSYWFWVGSDAEVKEMKITIYDKKGVKQNIQIEKGANWIGAKIDVAKSDTYVIAFEIVTKDGGKADWAVAYAYK